jgi:hypothetical protein
LIEFGDQNTHFVVIISQQAYFCDQNTLSPNMNVEKRKNQYFFIPINWITSSRYSSNVNACCLKRSSKLCNHAFLFTNNFFRGGNTPVAR